MTTFLFSYRMPKGYVPRGSDAVAAWTAWFEEMGTSVIDRGNPVFESASLGLHGSDTQLGGYSLITAEDLDTALAMTKGCPALTEGGGIEVGVITEVSPSRNGGAS